jgi:hypothetical protein
MKQSKQYLSEKDLPVAIPVRVKVFGVCKEADRMALKMGFHAIEPCNDARINPPCNAGFQNFSLHSGWIATMGDRTVSTEAQIGLLNQKIQKVLQRDRVIVGFYRTGNFSVGYSLYVKDGKAKQK